MSNLNYDDLKKNLCAEAHLMHGSTGNSIMITYCPGFILKEEIESVNFKYADLNQIMKKYNPSKVKDGFNTVDGEKIFYISNPAIGLWVFKDRFE